MSQKEAVLDAQLRALDDRLEKLGGAVEELHRRSAVLRDAVQALHDLPDIADRVEAALRRAEVSSWLTSREAARYLRVDTQTVRRWRREGRITGHTVGGHYRFDTRELDGQVRGAL